MIGIIDYGMGNLHSVSKALERLNQPYFLSEDEEELSKADLLILPGVGSFRDGMIELNRRKLVPFIQQWAAEENPLLGICLGMQLLFDESMEGGHSKGLELLPGSVQRFEEIVDEERFKVPHMGWNRLTFQQPAHALLNNLTGGHVYFVHSFYVKPTDESVLIASADYAGKKVPAVVGHKNIVGTQFHPEKSSSVGMQMLRNFTENY